MNLSILQSLVLNPSLIIEGKTKSLFLGAGYSMVEYIFFFLSYSILVLSSSWLDTNP